MSEVPTQSPESLAISQDMKKRGFSFCGATIIYAFMQTVGLTFDHEVTCFRHAALTEDRGRKQANPNPKPSGAKLNLQSPKAVKQKQMSEAEAGKKKGYNRKSRDGSPARGKAGQTKRNEAK